VQWRRVKDGYVIQCLGERYGVDHEIAERGEQLRAVMGCEGAFTEAGPGVTRREGSVLQVNIKASSLSVPGGMSVPRAEEKELREK
jgi:hypothetical protein